MQRVSKLWAQWASTRGSKGFTFQARENLRPAVCQCGWTPHGLGPKHASLANRCAVESASLHAEISVPHPKATAPTSEPQFGNHVLYDWHRLCSRAFCLFLWLVIAWCVINGSFHGSWSACAQDFNYDASEASCVGSCVGSSQLKKLICDAVLTN